MAFPRLCLAGPSLAVKWSRSTGQKWLSARTLITYSPKCYAIIGVIEMHASAVVSEVTVRVLFVLFLILRCAENREAFQGFQPFVCYKVIADCPP